MRENGYALFFVELENDRRSHHESLKMNKVVPTV